MEPKKSSYSCTEQASFQCFHLLATKKFLLVCRSFAQVACLIIFEPAPQSEISPPRMPLLSQGWVFYLTLVQRPTGECPASVRGRVGARVENLATQAKSGPVSSHFLSNPTPCGGEKSAAHPRPLSERARKVWPIWRRTRWRAVQRGIANYLSRNISQT